MSINRPLRGGCQCGRNHYIIQFPPDTTPRQRLGRVVFSTDPLHRSSLSTPLPAYLRVPLSCYRSLAVPFHPDETDAQIKRAYNHPREGAHAKRYFCGFCGTPLSYWSEDPPSEADFIQLALGSLLPEDLADLEDRGFLDSEEEEEGDEEGKAEGGEGGGGGEKGGGEMAGVGVGGKGTGTGGRTLVTGGTPPESLGMVGALPWFDTLTEGSRLGTLRRARGGGMNRAGTVRVEWDVVEWTDDDVGRKESPRKRKVEDVEDWREAAGGMERIQR